MTRVTRPPAHPALLLAAASLLIAACSGGASGAREQSSPATQSPAAMGAAADGSLPLGGAAGGRTVTLAFAGDVHFQLHLAALLDRPREALTRIRSTLGAADLTMVNLESAITERGTPDPKELEVSADRYWYRAAPDALDVLAAAGVDVVTMANNHAADYGQSGLRDTLAAKRTSPVPVVGIGRDRRAAFAPYRVSVRGTGLAFLAADGSMREGRSSVWAAGARTAGVAAARGPRPTALLSAVRAASRRDDVVVVYMHWGAEQHACPTAEQRLTARALAEAGADVVVGSHAHVLQGAGWLGSTYVGYGLGNFVWYHNRRPDTGVLRLTIRDGEVVGDAWQPARIQTFGKPVPVHGTERAAAIADWRRLRTCTGLAAGHDEASLPAYSWSMQRIGPELRDRMTPSSHRPGCPVPLSALRYLRMRYIGFDGRAHRGEMVVHHAYAPQVAAVFGRLYEVRWPIRRMRLVDDYGGDDGRSMAANNTSGFNCRRVAGARAWSAHAYGAAVDLNPVQNPDLSGAGVAPGRGRRYAAVERSGSADPAAGAIAARGTAVSAFRRIGWDWGGGWASQPDYQHFALPRASLE